MQIESALHVWFNLLANMLTLKCAYTHRPCPGRVLGYNGVVRRFTVTDPNMTHYLHKHTYTHSDSDCKPALGGGGGEGGTQDKRGAVNAFSIS